MGKQPHIVFITCHDLGKHLGCYGVPAVHTPNLDAIAAEGVQCNRAFCTTPLCSPSRAAIATGRYPHSNGVMGLSHGHFGWELPATEKHAATRFGEAGYTPVLFGIQHVTMHPKTLGFSDQYPERRAETIAANVRRYVTGKRPDGPLYLEINFFQTHRPFDFGRVAPDTEKGVFVPPYLPDNEAARSDLAGIQGAVRKVDDCIAVIKDALGKAGMLEDTVLIFTTDHGIPFPRAKSTLYDPGIETALLVRWPAGGISGGRCLDDLISNVDILPTLLDCAGVPIPSNVQGRSFRAALSRKPAGQPYTERDEIFAEKTFHDQYDPLRAIRTKRHKLIVRFEADHPVEVPGDIMQGLTYPTVIDQVLTPAGESFELYDLEADPHEKKNLSGTPEVANVERDLMHRLFHWMEETEDPLLHGPIASPFYYRTLAALRAAKVPENGAPGGAQEASAASEFPPHLHKLMRRLSRT